MGKEEQEAERVKPNNTKKAIVFDNHYLAKLSTNKYRWLCAEGARSKWNKGIFPAKFVGGAGENGDGMQTVNQGYYDVKKIAKNGLPEATMKELMGTHFNLGSADRNYST